MRSPFAFGAVLAIALLAQACSASERRVSLPDGRRINMLCMGRGSPTVVLESGYRGSSGAWYKVQPGIARFTRVCAYDRAGYGQSDPGPPPRDGEAVAHDLDAALRAAKIEGPFVMVGHSAGGLYVRLFSDLRPKEVVGMVLVDPSVEHQDQHFAAVFGPGQGGVGPLRALAERCYEAAVMGLLPSTEAQLAACTPKSNPQRTDRVWRRAVATASQPSMWRTALSELDTLWTSTSEELVQGRQSYGDMPLIVLTAEGTYAASPPAVRQAADALWRELHQQLAARSSRGEQRLVTGTSHAIMLDRPDAVVQAVHEVVDRARARTGGG
jgi:pimeloyl-ACP methyl ester carboxylesterase